MPELSPTRPLHAVDPVASRCAWWQIVTSGDGGGPVTSELNANREVNLVGTISGQGSDGLHVFYIDWAQVKLQLGW